MYALLVYGNSLRIYRFSDSQVIFKRYIVSVNSHLPIMVNFMCEFDKVIIPVAQSNFIISVAVRYFEDVTEVYNQLALSKEDSFR